MFWFLAALGALVLFAAVVAAVLFAVAKQRSKKQVAVDAFGDPIVERAEAPAALPPPPAVEPAPVERSRAVEPAPEVEPAREPEPAQAEPALEVKPAPAPSAVAEEAPAARSHAEPARSLGPPPVVERAPIPAPLPTLVAPPPEPEPVADPGAAAEAPLAPPPTASAAPAAAPRTSRAFPASSPTIVAPGPDDLPPPPASVPTPVGAPVVPPSAVGAPTPAPAAPVAPPEPAAPVAPPEPAASAVPAALEQLEKLRIADLDLIVRVNALTLAGDQLLAFTTDGFAARGRRELVLYAPRGTCSDAEMVRSLKRFAALALTALERPHPVDVGELLKLPGELCGVPLAGFLVVEPNEPAPVAIGDHVVVIGLSKADAAQDAAAVRAALVARSGGVPYRTEVSA